MRILLHRNKTRAKLRPCAAAFEQKGTGRRQEARNPALASHRLSPPSPQRMD